MKNQKVKKYLVIGIVVLVCFIVLGLGGYYLRKQTVQKSTTNSSNTFTSNTSNLTVYVNKTYGYSIKFPTTHEILPQTEKEKSQLGVDNNVCIRTKADDKCVAIVDVYDNKDNIILQDYLNNNLVSFGITGPLASYSFNGYDSLFNRNQPGTNVFVSRGLYVYHINAPAASSDKEIGDILATFRFTFLPDLSEINYSSEKVATVLVQDGSFYGPPFDPELYQLELGEDNHLFAKSETVELKQYLGKSVTVEYREVLGVVMSEQQLVVVDSIEE